jgi:hypothetical protein
MFHCGPNYSSSLSLWSLSRKVFVLAKHILYKEYIYICIYIYQECGLCQSGTISYICPFMSHNSLPNNRQQEGLVCWLFVFWPFFGLPFLSWF